MTRNWIPSFWTHPFRLSSYYGDAAVLTRPSTICQARNINFTFPRRYVAAHIELSNLTPPRARDYALPAILARSCLRWQLHPRPAILGRDTVHARHKA